jgi:hypothetical protein
VHDSFRRWGKERLGSSIDWPPPAPSIDEQIFDAPAQAKYREIPEHGRIEGRWTPPGCARRRREPRGLRRSVHGSGRPTVGRLRWRLDHFRPDRNGLPVRGCQPGSCPCPTRSAIAAKVDRCRTEATEGRDCQNRSYSLCQRSSIANGRPVEAVTRRPHPLVGIDGQINDGADQQDAHHEQ